MSVDQLWSDEEEVTSVGPGENVKIKLKVSSFISLSYEGFNVAQSFRVLKKKTSHLALSYAMLPIQLKLAKHLMPK